MSRIRAATILGLAVGAAGAVFGLGPSGLDLEEDVGLKWLFAIRGPIDPPAEVVVVSIDERAAKRLELPYKSSDWERCLATARHPETRGWPRCLHARLIDDLVRRGTLVIAIDMDFSRPRSPPDYDAKLADAISKAGRVVLFERLEKIYPKEVITSPIPALRDAAVGLGPFPLPKVPARVNQFWAFLTDSDTPTLPAVALQVHALSLFEDFVAHVGRAGFRELDNLPKTRADVKSAEDVRRLMRMLHRAIRNDPQALQRLRKALAAESSKDLTDGHRDVLNALLNLYDGDNDYHLNFYGPPGAVRTIPALTILQGEDETNRNDELDLSGKVVFVGVPVSSPDQKDSHYTVFTGDDGIDLSGVEIAATAFANLLTDRTLRRLSNLTLIAVIVVFGGLVGVLAYMPRGVLGVASASGASALYFGSAQFLFARYDLWLPLTTPMLVELPSVLLLGMILHYQGAIRTIWTLVPDLIANRIMKHQEPSAITKKVYGICLSTDAEGFMTVSEKLDPTELQSLMNEYFEVLGEPIVRHKGKAPYFAADSMMCVWPAPGYWQNVGASLVRLLFRGLSRQRLVPAPPLDRLHRFFLRHLPTEKDIRLQACLAALEIHKAVTLFNRRHQDRKLPTRIGLHAGDVVVGGVGGGGHAAYSLIGDSANVASRIEGLNKHLGTWILATEPVVADLDSFLMRRLGRFRLPGRVEPVTVFEVICLRESARDEQIDLCGCFDLALNAFETACWSKATELFAAILSVYPKDVPSKFFLTLCRKYSASPEKDPTIIEIEIK